MINLLKSFELPLVEKVRLLAFRFLKSVQEVSHIANMHAKHHDLRSEKNGEEHCDPALVIVMLLHSMLSSPCDPVLEAHQPRLM